MRSIIVLAAACLASMAPPAFAASDYHWKYRPLLVFAGADTSAALAEQRRAFDQSRAGFQQRDMVVVWIVGHSAVAELGPAVQGSAAELRKRHGVSAVEFRVVLVGKDGGVKLTSAEPLSAGRIFSVVDAMPMRRDEMRRR
jgi:hypothetical protein